MAKAPTDRVNITLRIPEHLRARLEDAAAAQDRSLNAEITDRLEHSFGQNDTLCALFGDDRIASFLLLQASILRTVREHLGQQAWRSDPVASKTVRAAMSLAMTYALAPDPEDKDKDQELETDGTTAKLPATLIAHLNRLLKEPR